MYVITRTSTGRRYVGKKNLSKRVTRPPLKGKKRKRRSVAPSDWLTYWGSNKELAAEVVELGESNFTREIVRLCHTRGEANYFEAKLQMELGVLERPDDFYNEQIRVRVHRSHLRRVISGVQLCGNV